MHSFEAEQYADGDNFTGIKIGIFALLGGAEFVVKRNAVANRWDALQGISVTDIRSVVTR